MRTVFILIWILLVAACQPVDEGQVNSEIEPEEMVRALSEVTTDAGQKALWQGVDAERLSEVGALVVSNGAVTARKPVEVRDVQVQRSGYPPLAESLTTAVHLLEVPDLDEPFDGAVKLVASEGDTLRFDLGRERSLLIQAKMGGRSFSADSDSEVHLRLQVGDPFERDDYLEISSGSSAFAWALVGGAEPVAIRFERLGLVARQIGKPAGGAMAVELRIGAESRTLTEFAEPVAFKRTGVTVHVLGSIGAVGDTTGVLPQAYRLEVVAWPKPR